MTGSDLCSVEGKLTYIDKMEYKISICMYIVQLYNQIEEKRVVFMLPCINQDLASNKSILCFYCARSVRHNIFNLSQKQKKVISQNKSNENL